MGHKLNSIHYLFKTGAIWSRQYAECNHLFWLVIFYLHIHNERIYYAKASIPPLSLCFSCHQYFCLQSATTTIIAAFAYHSKIAKYTVCVYKLASCLNQTGTALWMFIIFFFFKLSQRIFSKPLKHRLSVQSIFAFHFWLFVKQIFFPSVQSTV